MKKISFFILAFAYFAFNSCSLYAQSQYENLHKYWLYKKSLNENHLVTGDCAGCNLPFSLAHSVLPTRNDFDKLSFGDGSDFGPYLSVLATEFRLLLNSNANGANNQQLQETTEHLYYALKTYYRLENASNTLFNSPGFQGFWIRDDVPNNFLSLHPNLVQNLGQNLGYNIDPTKVNADAKQSSLTATATCAMGLSNASTVDKLMHHEAAFNSSDITASLFMGLAMVKKFVPSNTIFFDPTDNQNHNLVDMAKDITQRVIGNIRPNLWTPLSPPYTTNIPISSVISENTLLGVQNVLDGVLLDIQGALGNINTGIGLVQNASCTLFPNSNACITVTSLQNSLNNIQNAQVNIQNLNITLTSFIGGPVGLRIPLAGETMRAGAWGIGKSSTFINANISLNGLTGADQSLWVDGLPIVENLDDMVDPTCTQIVTELQNAVDILNNLKNSGIVKLLSNVSSIEFEIFAAITILNYKIAQINTLKPKLHESALNDSHFRCQVWSVSNEDTNADEFAVCDNRGFYIYPVIQSLLFPNGELNQNVTRKADLRNKLFTALNGAPQNCKGLEFDFAWIETDKVDMCDYFNDRSRAHGSTGWGTGYRWFGRTPNFVEGTNSTNPLLYNTGVDWSAMYTSATGLDYLLAYNLFHLFYLPNTPYFNTNVVANQVQHNIVDNFSNEYPFVGNDGKKGGTCIHTYNYVTGKDYSAYEIGENVKSSSVTSETGGLVCHGTQSVELLPGFEVENGAHFYGYVGPLTCNTSATAYQAIQRTMNSNAENDMTEEVEVKKNANSTNIVNQHFSLYPNPNNGSFTIALDDIPSTMVEITIRDLMGKILYQTSKQGEKNIEIDFSSFASGTYIVSVLSDKHLNQIKMIKE